MTTMIVNASLEWFGSLCLVPYSENDELTKASFRQLLACLWCLFLCGVHTTNNYRVAPALIWYLRPMREREGPAISSLTVFVGFKKWVEKWRCINASSFHLSADETRHFYAGTQTKVLCSTYLKYWHCFMQTFVRRLWASVSQPLLRLGCKHTYLHLSWWQ